MCKKETSFSHSSTEAEIISLDAGLCTQNTHPQHTSPTPQSSHKHGRTVNACLWLKNCHISLCALKRVSLLVTFMSHHPCWSFPSILLRDALHPALLLQRDFLQDTVHRQPRRLLPGQIPHEPLTRTGICKSENYAKKPLPAHSNEEYECRNQVTKTLYRL